MRRRKQHARGGQRRTEVDKKTAMKTENAQGLKGNEREGI